MSKRSDEIFNTLKNLYPDVEPELKYSNVYELSIAVILSAQTTDKQVNSVTENLFSLYPDFSSLSIAPISRIEKIIHSTGFYKNKSKHIKNLSYEIVNSYNGTLPDTIDELIKLPGIGRKSANVILSQGFNKPGLAVDTHVGRLARRLDLTTEKNPDKVEFDLKKIFPEKWWSKIHLLMIKHGRVICHSRNPNCMECKLNSLCSFPDNNQ
jgi:endonuclease-3